MKLRVLSSTALAAVILLGCDSSLSPELPAPQAAILDGAHGGNSYFRFVQGAIPQFPTANDRSLYPDLEICEVVNNACSTVVWRFSRSGSPPFERKINPGSVFYSEWNTALVNLDAAKPYRARVLLDRFELGYADIDVVQTSAELGSVDAANYIGVVKGSNARLMFWIGSGVFKRVYSSGGSFTSGDGNASLSLPRNAISPSIYEAHIGAVAATAPSGAQVVAGTYYEFLPPGMQFNAPVQLTIRYQEAALPSGTSESSLKLLRNQNGVWSEVPGSVVDAANNAVSGSIQGFSGYAVGTLGAPAPTPQPPAAPSGLAVTQQSPTSITLNWSDNSSDEQGFVVLKQTLPEGGLTPHTTLPPGTASFTDFDVIQGQTVIYQVQAFNSVGSTSSNPATAVVPTGQIQVLAPFNTKLTQTGAIGQAALFPPRVRLINTATGLPVANDMILFQVQQPNGTVVTQMAMTDAFGIATLPIPWVLFAGSQVIIVHSLTSAPVVFTAVGT